MTPPLGSRSSTVPGRSVWGPALVAAILALVIGIAAGVYLGRTSQPTLAEQVTQVRGQAADLAVALEAAGDAYATGFDDPTERGTAVGNVRRVASELERQGDAYGAVDAADYGRSLAAVEAVATALTDGLPPAEAEPLLDDAVATLKALAGMG
jgi:hypothetical protein